MKTVNVCLIGLVFVVCAWAEPLLEGRVRLESGEPVADAQVRLFDMTDLQRGAIARAQTDGTGYFALPLAALRGSALPEGFALGPNYPNPFNPSTIIPYQLAASSAVRLEVFNLLGQRIATLVDGERPAGFHTATWTATDAAGRAVGAGVYIYRMTVGVEHQTGRMVLLDGQAGVSAGGIASVLPGASGGGRSHGEGEEYGLIVSGSGFAPYMDSAFRVEAGMAPVELVVSAGLPAAGKATDEVSIPDAKLRAAIETALGKAKGAPITKGEMETLNDLEAIEVGISNLTGLEFATNLTWLQLVANNITDISSLSGLTNLTTLNFSGNNITDISSLSDLTNLWWLGLEYNQITDISSLGGLTNLTFLYLSGNQITDISPLRNLTSLIELKLRRNLLSASSINDHIPALQDRGVTVEFDPMPVTVTDDPTPVIIPDAKLRAAIEAALGKVSGATITKGEMTTLFTLQAVAAGISDLTGLEFATNLTDLNLGDNNISDLSPLSGLTNLTLLWLGSNRITDISPLRNLTNLTLLWLGSNRITDISPLRNLTNLIDLRLRRNLLRASSINDHIPALQDRGVTVEFDPTPVSDDPTPVTIPNAKLRAAIETVLGKASGATITKGEMTTLFTLQAVAAGISDLTGLEFAINLTDLNLSSNNISDLSPLSGLTNLTDLNLSSNNISDLSSLSGLTNLTRLWLGSNQITDISPLRNLTSLIELELRRNLLSASSINDHIPALQDRGVTVEVDPSDDPTPVIIPNAKLRAAIETVLGKASGATITKSEMTTLFILQAVAAGISDLTGLEFAINLTDLNLSSNNISDLSSLSGLTNLTDLNLSSNNISDLSSLSGLTNLTDLTGLDLSSNNISDLSSLSGLTNLTDLNLSSNNISDLSSLSGLTNLTDLTGLDLSSNNISDLSSLSGLTNLTELNLAGNQLTDLSVLSDLINLTELNLAGNQLTDLSVLSDLTNLRRLYLYFNDLTNISPLRGLTNLAELDLDYNNITNISALSDLTNLRILYLGDNNITNISPLSDLTNLRILYLGDNNITNISPLSGLTSLTNLGLGYNNLTNISPLRGLTNLYWLWLSGNNLKDVSKLASVLSGFDRLEWLALGGNNIRDISKLTPAVPGLTKLWLEGNDIKDISPLRRLTNLEWLWIAENNITDISALSSLTKLQGGGFGFNNISDLSPLAGLPNLTNRLHFEFNNITDVSPLAGLTDLKGLYLGGNNITDVSPLAGLTSLKVLDLEDNPLSAAAINRHIPRLQDRGVTVWFKPTPFREGDFDIEFVFLDPFTDSQKNVFRLIARKWTSVIVDDLPDYEFTQGWSGECGDESFRIPNGEQIDDLRIYVTSFDVDDFPGAVGWGIPSLLRETTHLPVLGCVAFDLKRANLFITGLHEIGHVLGFGPVWRDLDLLQDPNGDPHFNGPRAIAAFNDAGGQSYTGKKVPVQEDGVHWRGDVYGGGELMLPWGGGRLSAITVQSLADLGYGVDVTQADSFTLPGAAGKASAKIAATMPSISGVDVTLADVYTLPNAGPHWKGRIAEGLPLLLGDDRLRGVWKAPSGLGPVALISGIRDDRLMGRLVPSPQAVPALSCGAGLRQEPIHVIDPQGRIVRAISP